MIIPRPLGIHVLAGARGLSAVEHVDLIKAAGFDAITCDWNPEQTGAIAEEAAKVGLMFQSMHSPFGRVNKMWIGGDEEGEKMTKTLMNCVEDCANHDVRVMVIHPFIGFKDHTPTQAGLDNFARVIEVAVKRDVDLAFENVEGEEYLEAIMNEFASCPNVGFCYDTGHQMCYNGGRDVMAKYGSKLIHTHLNDNLGQRGPDITWLDDLHLPMGDGVADWKKIMASIKASPYRGILMCELNYSNKPYGHELDKYIAMEMDEFYAYALKKARFVTAL